MSDKKQKQKNVKRTMIGGQALMEGVMMRGSTSMAMAVRSPDGSIMLETSRLKGRRWYSKVPIVRGVVALLVSDAEAREKLIQTVLDTFSDKPAIRAMAEKIKSLALPGSDDRIVDEALALINAKP